MKFGPKPTNDAVGDVLAHSIALSDGALKKGRVLRAADVARLRENGIASVIVAELGDDDAAENDAAAALANALAPNPAGAHLRLSVPTAGRVNLIAAREGVLSFSRAAVDAVNAVDEAITLATLPPLARIAPGGLAATVKIIPYAAPRDALARAENAAAACAIAVAPFAWTRVALIQTTLPGQKPTLLEAGADAVRARILGLGAALTNDDRVAHDPAALGGAIRSAASGAVDAILILSASATSDRRDVCPAAIDAAGGRVIRVGMPVDPGNLLVLGDVAGKPVIGLPGCARSPALNGADWVMERLSAGLDVGDADIAAMGVGGLLKEIPSRPRPRAARPATASRSISAILLGAGGSSRMGSRHKLLESVDGAPLIRRSAETLLASRVDELVVVLGARAPEIREALSGLKLRIVEAPRWREGVAESLKAGLSAIAPNADAALIALADMPRVDVDLVDTVVAAFDPDDGAEIVRPEGRDPDGGRRPGHPTLFGARFFEALADLEGDVGARAVVAAHRAYMRAVEVDAAQLIDLDAPADWDAFRRQGG